MDPDGPNDTEMTVTLETNEPIDVSGDRRFSERRTDLSTRVEAIETLYDLWAGENTVKTTKLYVYILIQSILVTAYAYGSRNGPLAVPGTDQQFPVVGVLVPVIGIGSSWMSFVSIGRTVAFQKAWKQKRRELVQSSPEPVSEHFDFYPTARDKAEFPWWGKLTAKYVLLGPPMLGFALWLLVLAGVVVLWLT